MKKFLLIIIILLILSSLVFAKLSDETQESVEELRWKHYKYISLSSSDITVGASDFVYEWWSYYFKDGKFYVETQDGKWFIEMEKVKE